MTAPPPQDAFTLMPQLALEALLPNPLEILGWPERLVREWLGEEVGNIIWGDPNSSYVYGYPLAIGLGQPTPVAHPRVKWPQRE